MLSAQHSALARGAPQAPVKAARAWHRCASGHHPEVQLPCSHHLHRRDRATKGRSSPSVLTIQDTKVDEQQAAWADMAGRHIALSETADSLGSLLSLEFQSRAAPLLIHWDQEQDQPRHSTQETQQLTLNHRPTERSPDLLSMQPLRYRTSIQRGQQLDQSSPEPCQDLQQGTAESTGKVDGALVRSTLARGIRRSPSRQPDVFNTWSSVTAKPSSTRLRRAMSLGPSYTAEVPVDSQVQTAEGCATQQASSAGTVVSASHASQAAVEHPMQLKRRQLAAGLPSIRSVIVTVHMRIKKKGSTVLTRQEEHVLALWCQDWVALMAVRARLRHIMQRAPTAQEMARALNVEAAELRVRMAMGHAAKHLLVECNKGLVRKVIQQVLYKQQSKGRRTSMDDLMLEGTRGLLTAIQKFDPDRGLKLCTYAVPWIHQSAVRSADKESYVLDLPQHMQDKMKRLGRVSAQLINQCERSPTDDELLQALGWSAERLQEVRKAYITSCSSGTPVALDSSVNDDEGNMTLAESLSCSELQDDEGSTVRSTAEVEGFDGSGYVLREQLAQMLCNGLEALAIQEASVNHRDTGGESMQILVQTMVLLWTACTGNAPGMILHRTDMLDEKGTLCAALAALKLVRKVGFQPPEEPWLRELVTELGVKHRHVREAEVKLIALLHDRYGGDLAVLLQELQQPAAGMSPGNAAPRSTAGAHKKSK